MDLEIKEAVEAVSKDVTAKLAEVKKSQDELSEKLKVLDEKKAAGEDLGEIKSKAEETGKELAELGETVTELTKKLTARPAACVVVPEQDALAELLPCRESVEGAMLGPMGPAPLLVG